VRWLRPSLLSLTCIMGITLLDVACGSHKHPPIADLSLQDQDAGDTSPGGCDSFVDDDGGLSLIGQTATITGRVMDPAGKNPLYNVSVYVPHDGDKLPALKTGVSCDRCGSTVVRCPPDRAMSAAGRSHARIGCGAPPVGPAAPATRR